MRTMAGAAWRRLEIFFLEILWGPVTGPAADRRRRWHDDRIGT